jgi:hypothetical protein
LLLVLLFADSTGLAQRQGGAARLVVLPHITHITRITLLLLLLTSYYSYYPPHISHITLVTVADSTGLAQRQGGAAFLVVLLILLILLVSLNITRITGDSYTTCTLRTGAAEVILIIFYYSKPVMGAHPSTPTVVI